MCSPAVFFYFHMKTLFLLFLLLAARPVLASEPEDSIMVMFYNVENFFDCENDSIKDDEEFLPESVRRWHIGRFKKKAANISKVIINSGNGMIPAVVGLCEVENSYVMDYLTKYSPLKQLGYRYVMTDSDDERGIDVALMYQREQFRLISYSCRKVDTEAVGHRPTRDILHCCGKLYTGDTLDFIVAHLPSRRAGSGNAEKARELVMKELRLYADSLNAVRRCPNIIVMGDFNTYPDDENLNSLFNDGDYILLTAGFAGRTDIGTYKYRGIWQTIDHMAVSSRMKDCDSGVCVRSVDIVDDDYLLEYDSKYLGLKPFRTYYGMKYTGGFSDHLPLKLILAY